MTDSKTTGSVPNVRRAIKVGDVRRGDVQRRMRAMRAGTEAIRIKWLIKNGLSGRR